MSALLIFDPIPMGLCKDMIRTRSEELRTSDEEPLHLEASLRQAFRESLDGGMFPEIWTYIRARTPAPWGDDDITISFQAAGKVHRLTEDLTALACKYEILKGKHLELVRSSHDLQNFERVVNAAWQMRQLKHVNLEDPD